MEEKYAHLNNERAIESAFDKANQNFQYADACYLYDKYTDILKICLYSKWLRKLRGYLDSYKVNFYTPWYKLSYYDRGMITQMITYDLIKHLWENKLITENELYTITDIVRTRKICRYVFDIIGLSNQRQIFNGHYKSIANECDLYLLIHLMLSKVDNELLHISPLACHIYEFMDNSNYHQLRWTNNITYDEAINGKHFVRGILKPITTERDIDRYFRENFLNEPVIKYSGKKMFCLVASLQIFAFGTILLKALV